jgi:hypothetical protein
LLEAAIAHDVRGYVLGLVQGIAGANALPSSWNGNASYRR